MALQEPSKAARNEKRKLTAAYFNSLAIAFFVAGVAAPYYSMLAIPAADYVRLWQAIGTADGPRLTTVALWIGSWAISLSLHFTARGLLDDLED